jgi:hypothetical protein
MNNNIKMKHMKNRGQALLVALLFFAAGAGALLSGVAYSETKEITDVRAAASSKQSYFVSESALEDALYRTKTGKSVGTTDTISVSTNGATSTGTSTVASSGGSTAITSSGTDNNYQRNTSVSITSGTLIGLPYTAQVGTGGVSVDGGSSIIGSLYSNGPVTSDNSGSSINGSVTAAAPDPYSIDQWNDASGTPSQSVVFGQTSSAEDFAQSFAPATTSPVMKVRLYLKKQGSPSLITVRIVPDNAGSPGSSSITTGTISASSVTTSYTWIDVLFSSNPNLTVGSTYWIVLDTSSNASNYYTIAANSGYSGGTGESGVFKKSTWSNTSPSGLDGYFYVYTGGSQITSTAQSSFTVGSGSTGDAYADIVEGLSVAGNLYCQIGTLNNKSCNTSRASPLEVALPVTSSMISTWESDAAAGGVMNGDEHVGPYPNANVTIGPEEINGNLLVDGGGTLTVSGTLYVTGNVTIDGGASANLSSGYGTNDGIIVADGTVSLSGGGSVTGSGASGSFLMLVSNNSANPAITLNGGSNAVIATAPTGGVSISGGATANDVVAQTMSVDGGSHIIYQSAIANNDFINSPSSGSSISSWQEVP